MRLLFLDCPGVLCPDPQSLSYFFCFDRLQVAIRSSRRQRKSSGFRPRGDSVPITHRCFLYFESFSPRGAEAARLALVGQREFPSLPLPRNRVLVPAGGSTCRSSLAVAFRRRFRLFRPFEVQSSATGTPPPPSYSRLCAVAANLFWVFFFSKLLALPHGGNKSHLPLDASKDGRERPSSGFKPRCRRVFAAALQLA